MNKEIPQQNNEEFDAKDLQVISQLQNLRKEIKAPHESFLKAMKMLGEETLPQNSNPTKSPFYIPMFFKISVPALAVILIVGLSVKNNLQPNADPILEPTTDSASSFALVQNEVADNSVQENSLMKMSAPANENFQQEDFQTITEEEFSTYSNSSDEKFATYDETGVNNFVNYYGENF
ncbi:MAG TPA: hypothetical protein PK886_00160 [Candidatus Paceibacterota bacterium]|nr:hypothetical protein [Candidatus Paceibacterota bacterium]